MIKLYKWNLYDLLPLATILLLPWQARYIFGYHILGSSQYEFGVYSLYAGSLFVVLAALSFLKGNTNNCRSLVSWKLVVLYSWILIGAFFALVPKLTLWFALLLVIAFGYGIITYAWSTRKTIISFVIAGLIQAIYAWYQFIDQKITANTILGVAEHLPGVPGQSVVIILGERFLRAYGSLPHPNILAGVLVVAFALSVYLFVFHKRASMQKTELKWIAYIFASSLLFSSVLITFSRSAFIAIVALFIGWFIIAFKNKKEVMFLRLGQIFSICFALFFTFNVLTDNVWMQRIGIDSDPKQHVLDERSSEERISIYEDAISIMSTSDFILGVGANNFIPTYAERIQGLESYEYQPIHNSYLMILFELGIVGVMLFAWYAWSIFERKSSTYSNEQKFIIVTGISLLVIALLDHYLWTSYAGLAMTWLIFGLIVKQPIR